MYTHAIYRPIKFLLAIKFATGVTAEVIGKPEPKYFEAALKDMDIEAEYVSYCINRIYNRQYTPAGYTWAYTNFNNNSF